MDSTIFLGGWEKYLPADAITIAGELASRADAERAAGHTIFPPQQDNKENGGTHHGYFCFK